MKRSTLKFSDFVEIQPQVILERGVDYPFIEMADIQEKTKFSSPGSMRKWSGSGGSKFENEDILLAKITPCLEHGKTIKVNNLSKSKGFGSTELFVLRRRKNISDADYIYYLSTSSIVRGPAISGMVGTSGRQRVPRTALENIVISVPTLAIQTKIAAVLSAYDDLIKNNRRRIQLLEDSARLLYQEWFVHLRFPGFEEVEVVDGVPEGWDTAPLPVAIELNPTERLGKCTSIRGISMSALSESNMLIDMKQVETKEAPSGSRFRNGDTLLARITPCLENGKTAYVSELAEKEVACGSTEFIVMRGKLVSSTYTYCLARSQGFRDKAIKSMVGSSGRQRVVTSAFDSYTLAIPPEPLMNRFDTLTQPIFQQITTLNRQNHELAQARDLLLPRLMNGEIELETIAEQT